MTEDVTRAAAEQRITKAGNIKYNLSGDDAFIDRTKKNFSAL